METTNPANWQNDLRVFLRKSIKEQVVANVRDAHFRSVFPRRMYDFVEPETDKLLVECWAFFPIWHASYDATHWGVPLVDLWGKLEHVDKERVAKNFKEFFYARKNLWQSNM